MDCKIMANYKYEIDNEHNIYPNITVRKCLRDGVFVRWRINANEGYVFYDTTENNMEIDINTGEEISVTYYYTEADLPPMFNWDNFSYVAVPRNSVNADYVFGK